MVKRAVIIAHNHPRVQPGGAEIAAFDLARTLPQLQIETLFLTSTAGPVAAQPVTAVSTGGLGMPTREVQFCGDDYDYFWHRHRAADHLTGPFLDEITVWKPDVIHWHHFLRIGVEGMSLLKRRFSNIPHLLTLQEYLPLCYRDGQLVRRGSEKLCSGPSPTKCHRCFKQISAEKFAARKVWLQANMNQIDRFIAPSYFLAERYIDWGIPRERLEILDYGRPIQTIAPHRPLAPGERRNRFAYFGQITPYKGLLVLLRAAELLGKNTKQPWSLDIYGNLNETGFPKLTKEFNRLLQRTRRHVRFHGPYEPSELPLLMANIDWVIVPSTWWENSPLVIREAFGHRRPVIVSDAGGMAEKVREGVDGLRFQIGKPAALAGVMRVVLHDPSWWPRLVSNIRPPAGLTEYAQSHIDIYNKLHG